MHVNTVVLLIWLLTRCHQNSPVILVSDFFFPLRQELCRPVGNVFILASSFSPLRESRLHPANSGAVSQMCCDDATAHRRSRITRSYQRRRNSFTHAERHLWSELISAGQVWRHVGRVCFCALTPFMLLLYISQMLHSTSRMSPLVFPCVFLCEGDEFQSILGRKKTCHNGVHSSN